MDTSQIKYYVTRYSITYYTYKNDSTISFWGKI